MYIIFYEEKQIVNYKIQKHKKKTKDSMSTVQRE